MACARPTTCCPRPTTFDVADANAAEWLADAEIKISYAVLGYARDARGGRIEPARLSRNLDPDARVAQSDRSDRVDRLPLGSGRPISEAFSPISLNSRPSDKNCSSSAAARPRRPSPRSSFRTVPCSSSASSTSRWRCSGSGSTWRRRALTERQSAETKFDEEVAEAVRRFQIAHGAAPDGVVGAGTRRLLNGGRPPHAAGSPAQIRAVLLNMERWRWLPHDLGEFYVTVNIPEFMLRVVKDDGPVHTTRVVVGKTRHADARLLRRDADGGVRSLLERADLDQGG